MPDMTQVDLMEQVASLVREHGEMPKEDILTFLGNPPQAQYLAFCKRFLPRYPDILQASRGRGGGFRLRPDEAKETEVHSPLRDFSGLEPWQEQTIQRLTKLFDKPSLLSFVGDALSSAVRAVRRAQFSTGNGDYVTKTDLARALLIQHGADLFAKKELRDAVATALKITKAGKWHPGKRTAIQFVKDAGFPCELEGRRQDEREGWLEELRARPRVPGLESFQGSVKSQLLEGLSCSDFRAIVSLPTGAGKTRVAVETIMHWTNLIQHDISRGVTVLWLAHTEELCEQAVETFMRVWGSSDYAVEFNLVRYFGRAAPAVNSQPRDDDDGDDDDLLRAVSSPSIVVSTPRRVLGILAANSDKEGQLAALLTAHLRLIVIDEAHRAAARSYREVITKISQVNTGIRIVGLTATPFRDEYKHGDLTPGIIELSKLFPSKIIVPSKEYVGPDCPSFLREQGVLARPIMKTLRTHTILAREGGGENAELSYEDEMLIDKLYCRQADRTARRTIILKEVLSLCTIQTNSILYFGPTVSDAECMTYLLRENGVVADVVSGTTNRATRASRIARFRDGKTKVLCNCELLTTGFDAPRITHIIMARPTISMVLYEQMIGRGLRGPKFGGTASCTIINVEDPIRGAQKPRLAYKEWLDIWQATNSMSRLRA